MSRSNKSRYGMHTKYWKDSIRESRSQKQAWSKRKKIETRQRRRRGFLEELSGDIEHDSGEDYERGYRQLSATLSQIANYLDQAAYHAKLAWRICEQHMKEADED